MDILRLIGNILWFVLGGVWMGLGWWLAGLIAAVTIVGLPWARACFVIGAFSFLPFGKRVVDRTAVTGREDLGTGPLGFLGNIVWFLVAGWWLALGHIVAAALNVLSIIGIPFAVQHLKLAQITLAPVGKTVTDTDGPWGVQPGKPDVR
jgi:uncharacterized membrane protein YccF (DUF307 family)